MELQPQNRPLAEPAVPQQALDQPPAETADVRAQLEAANRSLQARLAQRTAQLQAAVAEITCTEQRERHRLAQLLHDDLEPLLDRASRLTHALDSPDRRGGPDKRLQDLADLLNQSLAGLRSFSAQVSPPILYKGTMTEILRWLAGRMWTEYELAVQVDADPQADAWDEEIRILLFQVVRELLDNVLKHAAVRTARIALTRSDADSLTITVSDNGVGFDPTVKLGQGRFSTGLGLSTLRRRMELLGGRMDIHSAPARART